ncbi:MAG: aminoacetone oxidase family FAD-binding enzyme [Roseburia sp.]|nr:aminoacetone oxidase family FAD-binding enzyme [Roseburia sp.]
MEHHEIIIAGAGAAGLMCAYLLGRQGHDVLLLEKNASAGRKLLATGNGRCNFTNRHMSPECYYGDRKFIEEILGRFQTEDAIGLFEQLGIYHRERDGYCYPYSGQASTVVELLEKSCREAGVRFLFDTRVSRIVHKKEKNGKENYEVACKNNICFSCGRLILATGGKACAELGGDGSGYKLSRSLSHHVTEIFPGLTGLKASGKEWKQLSGVRMQGKVSLYVEGDFIKSEVGEIQIVKDGISGIPVFQLCRLAAGALSAGKEVRCVIDFLPEWEEELVEKWLFIQGEEKLQGLVNQKWVPVIRKRAKELEEISRLLKNYEVVITDTFGLERAQVTAGGVPAEEIDPGTMQSKLHKNLFLLGELIDVDGICGGYNLHFAWGTAYLCAEAIG